MRHSILFFVTGLVSLTGIVPGSLLAQAKRTYTISAETVRGIEQAAPGKPLVQPARQRKVLVYGRMPTHPESVVCCFKAL